MMKAKTNKLIILFLSIALSLSGCAKSNTPTVDPNSKISHSEFMLNTYITITLYGTNDSSLFEEIFNTISELENILSVHIEGSDLDLMKDNAGLKAVKVSEDTFSILEKSIKYSELSEGLFDITAGPLISLWAIGTENQKVPAEEEIKIMLDLIDYRKINLNPSNMTAYLPAKNMSVNLGAIAKGYIADKAAEKIIELGVESAILNLGGNVILLGTRPDGSDFRVGIQHPDEPRGKELGIITGSNLSIVSSGDYERYFIENNIKYHHILNPFTGYPADTSIKSVSIITDNSFDGDALSTTVLLFGLDKGIKLIESLENTEAIFVSKNNEIYITDGIKDSFELTSETYKIIN